MTQNTFLQHSLLSVSLAAALSLAPFQLSYAADDAAAVPNYAEQVMQIPITKNAWNRPIFSLH